MNSCLWSMGLHSCFFLCVDYFWIVSQTLWLPCCRDSEFCYFSKERWFCFFAGGWKQWDPDLKLRLLDSSSQLILVLFCVADLLGVRPAHPRFNSPQRCESTHRPCSPTLAPLILRLIPTRHCIPAAPSPLCTRGKLKVPYCWQRRRESDTFYSFLKPQCSAPNTEVPIQYLSNKCWL